MGLVSDLGLEAGGAAAAVEGLGDRVLFGTGDPGIARDLRERGRGAAREWMPVADEEGRGVVEERGHDGVLAVDAAPVVVPHKGELDLPVLQHRPQSGDAGTAHRQPYVGVRVAEGDDGGREQGGTRRGESADTESARAQSREVGEFVVRSPQLTFDPLPALSQDAPGIGEGHAPRMALQKGLAGLRLQAADLLRHR